MTTYSNTLKLDSLPLFDPTTGYIPSTKLNSLPLFEIKLGSTPSMRIVIFEDDRPRSGQLYPRSL